MCKVTQFFHSIKVRFMLSMMCFFLLHYIWNIPKMVARTRLFHLTWKRDGKAPYPICGEWGIFSLFCMSVS